MLSRNSLKNWNSQLLQLLPPFQLWTRNRDAEKLYTTCISRGDNYKVCAKVENKQAEQQKFCQYLIAMRCTTPYKKMFSRARCLVWKGRILPNIEDANKSLLKLLGAIKFAMQLDLYNLWVDDFVCKSLTTSITLKADFSENFEQAIQHSCEGIKLGNRTKVPIWRDSLRAKHQQQRPLQKDMYPPIVPKKNNNRPCLLSRASETTNIFSERYAWVLVHIQLYSLVIIQPDQPEPMQFGKQE